MSTVGVGVVLGEERIPSRKPPHKQSDLNPDDHLQNGHISLNSDLPA